MRTYIDSESKFRGLATLAVLTCAALFLPAAAQAADEPTDEITTVQRADGRIDQFTTDTAPAPQNGSVVLHRSQPAPGAPYGPWEQLGENKTPGRNRVIVPIENADGRLEVFWHSQGTVLTASQVTKDGAWTPAAGFGLGPAPWHGSVIASAEKDGRFITFAVDSSGNNVQWREQDGPSGTWQDVEELTGPEDASTGIQQPKVTTLPDGGLQLTVFKWSFPATEGSSYYRITQQGPFGPWGTWEHCSTVRCA
ncbi:hypothetical protein D5S17_08410 [Pseudonocardiaceae bacterium YIM PH 21723]|nr:hypothetical protein D5S17_08410 [Pseudonocardiaceae bacterium YIM PH 21723]